MELGHLMRTLKRKDDAIGAYKAALEIDPDNVPVMLALSHQLRGRWRVEEAVALLRRAIEIAPDNVDAHTQLAELLALGGRAEEAEACARRAVDLDSRSARAVLVLGKVLASRDRFGEAATAYERAIELNDSYVDARMELLAARRMIDASRSNRTRPAIWPGKVERFDNVEKLVRDFVLADYRPEQPVITKSTRVSAFGSCFAGHVAQRLQDRGVAVFYRRIAEDINNTYANRYLLDWIVEGPVNDHTVELESIYGAEQREKFRRRFGETELFIITLGVAPAFFSRETGAFVLAHGGASETKLLPQICDFRTTTVSENLANVRHILARIRLLSPAARFVITVSPVPLMGTYEMGSAVVADTLSKATLRLTVDELLRSGEAGVYYWPAFEIVRWLGAHLTTQHPPVYGADDGYSRHVSVWLVDLIMKLFIEYFGDASVQPVAEAAD